MKDRFKFRVWYDPQCDGIEPRYFYDVQNIYDGSDDGLGWISCFGDLLDDEQYTIEQCTGLTDKNGKLIYEGDIIERSTGHKKTICFHQGGFGWWTDFNDFISFSGHAHLEEILQNHEIIGNIHEKEKINA